MMKSMRNVLGQNGLSKETMVTCIDMANFEVVQKANSMLVLDGKNASMNEGRETLHRIDEINENVGVDRRKRGDGTG